MSSIVDISGLPSSDSPTVALLHPTPEENLAATKVNGLSWRGPLSLEAYIRREKYLANQALTRDGGLTVWILVDTSETSTPRTILASCETLRKRALIRRQNGQVEETVAYGIASVFCNPEFRGKGYARRMIQELGKALDTWQHADGEVADFTILFSDIGKVRLWFLLTKKAESTNSRTDFLLEARMEAIPVQSYDIESGRATRG